MYAFTEIYHLDWPLEVSENGIWAVSLHGCSLKMILLPGICGSFIHFLHCKGISLQKTSEISFISSILLFSHSYLLILNFLQLAFFEFSLMYSFLQPLSILFHMFIILSIIKPWIFFCEIVQLHGNQLFGTNTGLSCYWSPWVNK